MKNYLIQNYLYIITSWRISQARPGKKIFTINMNRYCSREPKKCPYCSLFDFNNLPQAFVQQDPDWNHFLIITWYHYRVQTRMKFYHLEIAIVHVWMTKHLPLIDHLTFMFLTTRLLMLGSTKFTWRLQREPFGTLTWK